MHTQADIDILLEKTTQQCLQDHKFDAGYDAGRTIEWMQREIEKQELRASPITSVRIVPECIPSNEKIPVVKFIRERCITKPGLKEAKELTETGGYIHVLNYDVNKLPACLRPRN